MNPNVLFIGLALLVFGCSSSREPALDPVHDSSLLQNQSITVSNQERRYHLYQPADPATAPMVLVLHGHGGSHDQVLGLERTKAPHKVWLDIARQENILLVVPDGSVGPNGKRGWNDCRNDAPTNSDVDDVKFIDELIKQVQSQYGSDQTSVFVVGTSNGGHMAMRLGAEMPEPLHGLAFIVSAKPVNSECLHSTAPLPVLIMNGTADPLLPYNGGQIDSNRGEVYSTPETVNYWVTRNQTDTTPEVINVSDNDLADESTINRFSYRNGTGRSMVEHYEVLNGGHTEPSLLERYSNLYKLIVGTQNGDIEMAYEVWEFFKNL